jgi:hypothetical protein
LQTGRTFFGHGRARIVKLRCDALEEELAGR